MYTFAGTIDGAQDGPGFIAHRKMGQTPKVVPGCRIFESAVEFCDVEFFLCNQILTYTFA